METDFEQFKKLAPERRLKELQKLIDTLKKEVDERQKDIREAEHLLVLADGEARVLEQVEIPETRTAPRKKEEPETIEEKATPVKKSEAKRLTREEQKELERLLATAPPRSEELFHRIAHRPVSELYSELRKIYDRERTTGIETSRDREMIYAISRGLEAKKKDVEEGEYRPVGKAKHLMTAAEQMAENMYQSTSAGYKRA
jgi:hypothetical protein